MAPSIQKADTTMTPPLSNVNSEVQNNTAKPVSKLAQFLKNDQQLSQHAVVPQVRLDQEKIAAVVIAVPPPSNPTAMNSAKPNKLAQFLSKIEGGNQGSLSCTESKSSPKNDGFKPEVIVEKQPKVSDLICKAGFSSTNSIPLQEKAGKSLPTIPAPQQTQDEKTPRSVRDDALEARNYAEKVIQLNQEIEILQGKLADYEKKCSALEQEVITLRARVEVSESGKETLIEELYYLKSMEKKKSVKYDENFESSITHAKKLLAQGKISQAQYQAAVNAATEAKKAVLNTW